LPGKTKQITITRKPAMKQKEEIFLLCNISEQNVGKNLKREIVSSDYSTDLIACLEIKNKNTNFVLSSLKS
jgi:hypothetical protein